MKHVNSLWFRFAKVPARQNWLDKPTSFVRNFGMGKRDSHKAMLDAAIMQFNQYGYHKTSMDDISSRLGLSRSLLYRYFENKEDIFRQASWLIHQNALDECNRCVKAHGNLEAKIVGALLSRHKPFLEAVINSAHGSELFDEYSRLCGTIVQNSNNEFELLLTDIIDEAARDSRIEIETVGIKSKEVAWLLNHSVAGLKHGVATVEDFELRIRALVKMSLLGLEPR